MYAQDYDATYPPALTWMDSVEALQPDDGIFRCPMMQQSDIFAYGYAFNSSLGQVPLTAVLKPSQTPLVFDSARTRKNANDQVTSLPDPPRHRGPSPGRPGQTWGNNIVYADGHVELVPRIFYGAVNR